MTRLLTRLLIIGLLAPALTGCLREAGEAIDAGVGCLRTQGCWR